MPKLSTDLEQSVELSPELQQRLESSLAMYDVAKQLMDKERQTIEAILNEGEARKGSSADYDAFITVGGTSSSFDKKKAIALGFLTEAQIAQCTTRKPKKPFLTIKKKGEKTYGDD